MAGEILDEYADRISQLVLMPGSGGIFQIRIGDELVYDKKNTGRFPKPGEARELVAARL